MSQLLYSGFSAGDKQAPVCCPGNAGRHFPLPQQGREGVQVTSWTDPTGLQTAGAPQRHTCPGPGWPLCSLPGTGLSHPLEARLQTEQVEPAPFWDILEDGELGKGEEPNVPSSSLLGCVC